MWTHLADHLIWSAIGLFGGAMLAELGWDVRTLIRNSGRRQKDDHT